MIILTINGLNSQVKGIGWLNGLKKKKGPNYMLPTSCRHTYPERGRRKDVLCKQNSKENKGSYTDIRQNIL
jgi:hypothetical protein